MLCVLFGAVSLYSFDDVSLIFVSKSPMNVRKHCFRPTDKWCYIFVQLWKIVSWLLTVYHAREYKFFTFTTSKCFCKYCMFGCFFETFFGYRWNSSTIFLFLLRTEIGSVLFLLWIYLKCTTNIPTPYQIQLRWMNWKIISSKKEERKVENWMNEIK